MSFCCIRITNFPAGINFAEKSLIEGDNLSPLNLNYPVAIAASLNRKFIAKILFYGELHRGIWEKTIRD
jgi:hypothetical protein